MSEFDEYEDDPETQADDALSDAVHPRCEVTKHPGFNDLAAYVVRDPNVPNSAVSFLCEIHGKAAQAMPEAKRLVFERL